MSTFKRALNNSAILLVSQIITWTTTIVLTAFLGRALGATGFGEFYLAVSFVLAFSVLVEFGLDQQLLRAVARDRDRTSAYLVNSLAIKATLWIVAALLILGLTEILHYGGQLRLAIAIYSLILLFNGITAALGAVYKAHETTLYPAVGTILEKLVNSVIAAFLLSRGHGVVAMATVFVLGAAINALWQLALLRRVAPLTLALDREMIGPLVKGALPFLMYWVFGSIYFRIDVVLLSKLADTAHVGWYGAAYRLFDTLGFLPGIVAGAVMFPILSRLSVQSRDNLRLAASKGLNVLLMAGIPICAGLIVLAEPIIRLLYGGDEFLPAVPALRWLAPALLFLYINSALGVVIISVNQERKMTVLAGLTAVFNLGLNLLLIPHFQHLAAAALTAATELFILCYLLVVFPRDLWARNSAEVLLKGLAAAGIMSLVLYGLRGQHLVLLVAVGGIVYVLSGLLLRLVPPEDLRLVREAIALRRGHGTVGALRREAAEL